MQRLQHSEFFPCPRPILPRRCGRFGGVRCRRRSGRGDCCTPTQRRLRCIEQLREARLVGVLRPRPGMAGQSDPIALFRVGQVVPDLAGQILEIVESLNLPAWRVATLHAVGRLGHEEASATGDLEDPRLDLAASREPRTVKDLPGVPEIKADQRFPYDPRNFVSGDSASRPPVTEAGSLDPLFPEPIDPCRTIAVAGPDESHSMAAFPRRQRLLESCASGGPLGQEEIIQAVPRSLLQSRSIGRGVEIEMGRDQAGKLPVFPGIVGRPVDESRTADPLRDIKRLHPQLVMHEDAKNNIRFLFLNCFQKTPVQMRKIIVAPPIEGLKKNDVMAKGPERRQEIGKLIPLSAFAFPVVVFAEGAENLQDGVLPRAVVRVAVTW